MLQVGGRGSQRMVKSTSSSTGECKSDKPTPVKSLRTISLVEGDADEAGDRVSGGDVYEGGNGTWQRHIALFVRQRGADTAGGRKGITEGGEVDFFVDRRM